MSGFYSELDVPPAAPVQVEHKLLVAGREVYQEPSRGVALLCGYPPLVSAPLNLLDLQFLADVVLDDQDALAGLRL